MVASYIKLLEKRSKNQLDEKADSYLHYAVDGVTRMNDPIKDKIFVVFQRLHSRRAYPGTGIGLAICKRIINRHGGEIWVESESDKDAAFYFTLPKVM